MKRKRYGLSKALKALDGIDKALRAKKITKAQHDLRSKKVLIRLSKK